MPAFTALFYPLKFTYAKTATPFKQSKGIGYSFDGVHAPANNKDRYSLAYSQFIMPLVKGMQEQQSIIESQNKKLSNQDLLKKIN